MAMYSAYFDESGDADHSGSHLVVAGAVADVDQWVHFEREWLDALRPYGTQLFHANEFYQRKNRKDADNPFRGLTDGDAQRLITLLAGIICRRAEKTFSCAIPLKQYRAVNDKYLFAEYFGHAYPAAGRSCINRVFMWADKHSIPRGDVKYFFENGATHKGQLQWLAEKDGFPIPVFLEKREFIQLQAGDFVAWHTNAFLEGTIDGIGRSALQRLAQASNQWSVVTMLDDTDKVPAIFEIPLRDPQMNYKWTILKKHGRRHALIHRWSKAFGPVPPIVKKGSVTVNEPTPALDGEGFDRALAAYEAAHSPQADGGTLEPE